MIEPVNWQPVAHGMSLAARVLTTPFLSFGETRLSLVSVSVAGAIIYFGVVSSRIMQRIVLLRFEDKTVFERGPGYAVMRIVHYVIIVASSMVALQTIGFRLTSVAVVGGFLGVGLGFGLKNVTENFISGIILLLEQPIRVGDKVSVQDLIGTVKRIGIRSTVIDTFDNITLILPNSVLVQEQVINWSHSDPKIRIHVPFGVAYGSDIPRLRAAAIKTALDAPRVLKSPSPELRFLGFGDSSLDFDLLVWIDEPLNQFVVKSDIYYALERALRESGIEIPFPQRDVHIKTARGLQGAKIG
ncbi:MAG: mechanosensitive ion channel domain-containing protein [Elusimicrobiota bacterium]